MWVAKIKISSQGTLIGEKVKKYNLDLFGFPLSYSYDKKWVTVQMAGTLIGSEENKKAFVKEMKREKRVLNLELNGDFVIGTIKDPIYMNDLYQKDIFHISPALISSKGFEVVEIGSFNRKLLAKVIDLLEKRYKGKLIFFNEKKIKSLSIVKIQPELTNKQKEAMTLALKNGYYEYPRKTSIEELAKISKHSFSTFHAHLRKAEHKLLPFYFEQ